MRLPSAVGFRLGHVTVVQTFFGPDDGNSCANSDTTPGTLDVRSLVVIPMPHPENQTHTPANEVTNHELRDDR
jgi:hypothetical protein